MNKCKKTIPSRFREETVPFYGSVGCTVLTACASSASVLS